MVWVKKGSGRVGAGSAGSSRKQGEQRVAAKRQAAACVCVVAGGLWRQEEAGGAEGSFKRYHLVWLQMSGGQLQYVVYHLLLHKCSQNASRLPS